MLVENQHTLDLSMLIRDVEYVYLTSDVIMSKGALSLWEYLCHLFSAGNPFIITSPGADSIKSLPEYQFADPNETFHDFHERWSEELPYKRHGFFSPLKRSWETNQVRKTPIVIMNNPLARWTARQTLADNRKYEWEKTPEKEAIIQALAEKSETHFQVLFSQDLAFLKRVYEIFLPATGPCPIHTYYLTPEGRPVNPFEVAKRELRELSAEYSLNQLIRKTPVFMDESAIKHPQAKEFLTNAQRLLRNEGSSISLMVAKNKPIPHSEQLLRLAQEQPAIVRFCWLPEEKTQQEGILSILHADKTSWPSKISAIITDRVDRAEKIQAKLDACGYQLDIYSINRYGYLSQRDIGKPGLKRAQEEVRRESCKRQAELAVTTGNHDALLAATRNDYAWEEAARICIEQSNSDLLAFLIDSKLEPSPQLLEWWILKCRKFQSPSYLAVNPRFYELMVQLVNKLNMKQVKDCKLKQMVNRLSSMREVSDDDFVELRYIHSLLSLLIRGEMLDVEQSRLDNLPRTDINNPAMLRIRQQSTMRMISETKRQIRELNAELDELNIQLAEITTFMNNPMTTMNTTNTTEMLTKRNLGRVLYTAAETGNLQLMEAALEFGADPNFEVSYGFTPLIIACHKAQTECVKRLLYAGAEVNQCNDFEEMPLHYAVQSESEECVTMLLENNALVNWKDQDNLTALGYAQRRGNVSICNILKKYNAAVAGNQDYLEEGKNKDKLRIRQLALVEAAVRDLDNKDVGPHCL